MSTFDEETVREYNAFPIPRLLLADVIAKLASAKPAVIGVDIILDIHRAEADDHHLAKVIDDAGNVILISEYGFDIHPSNKPLDMFEKAAAGVAFGDLPTDEDGSVRRMFLKVTTTSLQSSLPARGPGRFFLRSASPSRRPRFPPLRLAKNPTRHHPAGHRLDPFSSLAPTTVIPVKMLLSEDFDPHFFQGRSFSSASPAKWARICSPAPSRPGPSPDAICSPARKFTPPPPKPC